MKFLIKNTNVVLLIVSLFLLVACGGADERKASYIAKAKTYEADKNYEKARIELKNALQIDPKDIEARQMLGDILVELKEWQKAAGHYKSIMQLDESHLPSRINLARLFYLSRNFKDSRQLLDEVLLLDPNNPDGLVLSASLHANEKNYDLAIDEGLRALKQDPENLDGNALLATLYSKKGLTEKSEKLFRETINMHPDNIEIRLLLANFYMGSGRKSDAIIIFKNIIKISPDKLGYRVRLAYLLISVQKIVEAEMLLKEAISLKPEDAEAKLVLVDFYIQQKRTDKAEKQLLEFIRQSPEEYKLHFGLAKFYEELDQIRKAKKVYQDIIQSAGLKNDGLESRVMLARIFVAENNNSQAAALIDKVLLEESTHTEALLLRGEIALQNNDAVTAIADFRVALRDNPNSSKILELLAKGHVLNKEYEQAIDNIKRGLALDNKDSHLSLVLARTYSISGNIDKAINQYQSFLEKSPDILDAKLELFNLLMKVQDHVAAEKLANVTKQVNKKSHLGYQFSGLVYMAKKQYADSILELELALDKKGDDSKILAALTRSYVLDDRVKEAIKRVKKFVKDMPNDVVALNILAEVLIFDKQIKQALVILNEAKKIKPDWINTYNNIVRVRLSRSNKEGAFKALDEGLKNTNNSLNLVIEKSMLHQKFKEFDKAAEVYETALKLKQDTEVLANNLAMLLVTHKTDKKSMTRARELVDLLINNDSPAYKDSVGWVLYKVGETNKAIPYLEEAVAKLSGIPAVNYHIGMAYYAVSNMEKAGTFLEKALGFNVKFDGQKEAQETLNKIKKANKLPG